MSVNYYAYAVLGCALPKKFPPAIITVRKRAFDHEFPDDGEMKFDPKTAKPLWLDETEEVEADYEKYRVVEDWYESDEEAPGQIVVKVEEYGLKIAATTDDKKLVVGLIVQTGYDSDVVFMKLDEKVVTETREKVKKLMKAIESWDASKFGLYTVLHCSY